MPFSWEAARQPLVSGGMGIVQSLLQESGRQKEEERLIEREKRQYDLFLKELDKKFEKNKELAEFRKELDADYDRKLKGNLDLNRLYDEAALPDASAETKALVEGIKTINQKQLNFMALGEGDYAFNQKLIDAGFGAIPYIFHEREMSNARLIKQLESREKQYELLAGARQAEAETKREITYRKERTKYRTKQQKEITDINEEISDYREKLKKEEAKARKEVMGKDLTKAPELKEEEPAEPAEALKGEEAKEFDVPIGKTKVTGEMPIGAPLIEYFHERIRELEEKRDALISKREREIGGTATAEAPEVRTGAIIPPEIQLVMDEFGISFEEAMRFEEERKKKYGIK